MLNTIKHAAFAVLIPFLTLILGGCDMATKPTVPYEWATDASYASDGDPWGGEPTKLDPGPARRAEGAEPDTFPAPWYNHTMNAHGQWIEWAEKSLDEVRTYGGVFFSGLGGPALLTTSTFGAVVEMPEDMDSSDNYTPSADAFRAPADGDYLVEGHLSAEGLGVVGTSGQFLLFLQRDGVDLVAPRAWQQIRVSEVASMHVSHVLRLTEGQRIELLIANVDGRQINVRYASLHGRRL